MSGRWQMGWLSLATAALVGCGIAPGPFGPGANGVGDDQAGGASAEDGVGADDAGGAASGAERPALGMPPAAAGGSSGGVPGAGGAAAEQVPGATCWLVAGNPTCADVGLGDLLAGVDPLKAGTYPAGGGTVEVAVSSDGTAAAFASTAGVGGAVVKAGAEALVCTYHPAAYEDDSLVVQLDGVPAQPHAISHLLLCARALSRIAPPDGRD